MLRADYFFNARQYAEFIQDNPDIKILYLTLFDGKLVVTWEEENSL